MALTPQQQRQVQVQDLVQLGLDNLLRGKSVGFTDNTPQGAEALRRIRTLEQRPDVRQALRKVEETKFVQDIDPQTGKVITRLASKVARERGFDSVTEFRQVTGAFQKQFLEQKAQPRSSFVSKDVKISISREDLEKQIQRGDIKKGGTFRDASGRLFEVSVPRQVTPKFDIRTPTPTSSKQPLMISATPNLREQLKRNIKDAKPELGDTRIRNIVESAIGVGLGTKRFTQDKLFTNLLKLKDVEGNRIFSDEQARNIANFGKRLSEITPKEKEGIVSFIDRKKKKDPLIIENELVITEVKGERGTLITEQRQKTFFEKIGINPNDKDAQELKRDIEKIQSKFNDETISETKANKQLEKEFDDYTKKQILKGIPANLAIGAGIGLISAIFPVTIPFTTSLFVGDAVLKRDELAGQFKKFPKESALSTASFLVGGLAGGKIGGRIKGNLGSVDIKAENLESTTFLGGKEKTKLTNTAFEFFPEVKALLKDKKITSTIAYEIKLKDGKIFKVIEFSKIDNVGKVDKQFIGFEVAKKGVKPETFIGRGRGIIKGKEGETFIRILKLQPSNTKLSRVLRKDFSSGRLIDILEKTRTGRFTTLRKGQVSISQFESVAGIFRNKIAKGNLIKQTEKLLKDINDGKQISTSRLKQLINIQRTLDGKKPFTSAEFNSIDTLALTNTQLIGILNKIKISFERTNIKGLKTISEKLIGRREDLLSGIAITKGKKVIKEVKLIKKTPLSKTFRQPSLIERAKKQAGKSLGEKYKQAQSLLKKKQKQKKKPFVSPPSVSAAAFGAGFPISRQQSVFLPSFTGGALSLGFSLTPSGINRNIINVKRRITLVDKNIIKLRSVEILSEFQKERIKVLEKQKSNLISRTNSLVKIKEKVKVQQKPLQKQALRLRQEQRQKLRQKQIARQIPRKILRRVGKPFTPPPPPPNKKVLKKVKKKVKKIPFDDIASYNVIGKPIKAKNFVKLNVVPLKKNKARDLGAFLTDHSLARTYKLVPLTKDARKPKLKVPKSYASKTQKKFRNFRISKGKKIPLINTWIEKKGKFLLDTRSEKKQIKLRRKLAELKSKFKVKPRKRKKR